MSCAARNNDAVVATLAEKSRFLRWQCRVRQKVMREKSGRPDAGIAPAVKLAGGGGTLGQIVTVLSKRPEYSKTPELMHIARRTFDPAQRREKALQYFSETYFQKADEFSDLLTATFPSDSASAAAMERADDCLLVFDAYGQHFELRCNVKRLAPDHWLYQATWWHNYQFNPNLNPDAIVLAFAPDWSRGANGS